MPETEDRPTLASFLADVRGDAVAAARSRDPAAIDAHQIAARGALAARFDRLPRFLDPTGDTPSRGFLASCGFTVHADLDDLMLGVVPPPGWGISASNQPNWCDVRDGRGNRRFRVFLKAAHYDRQAYIATTCRFDIGVALLDADGNARTDGGKPALVGFVVNDRVTDAHAWAGDLLPYDNARSPDAEVRDGHMALLDAQESAAKLWLTARHPAWRDPAACWDD